MATFLNGVQWGTWGGATKYATLTGDVSRDGSVVKLTNLRLYFTMNSGYANGYRNTVDVRDGSSGTTVLSSTSAVWSFSGSASNIVSLNDASVTVGASDTSHSFNIKASDDSAVASFNVSFPSGAVAPDEPMLSVVSVMADSISVDYGTASFGAPSTGTITLYCDTSSTPTTEVESKNTTGNTTVTISNLLPGTTYYIRAVASNDQLSSESTISVTTNNLAMYGSVDGRTKKITKLYGSKIGYEVTGGAIVNDEGYAKNTIVSFDPAAFMTQYAADFGGFATEPMYAYVAKSGDLIRISSTRKSPSGGYFINLLAEVPVPTGAYITRYGITVRNPSDASTSGVGNRINYLFEQSGTSVKIAKLYGSADGVTKRIF